MLELQGLQLVRTGTALLTDINARFVPGEFVAIVGPNGAGKSSLVRALTGEWSPRSGQVMLDDKPFKSYSRANIAQRMAIVPQASNLGFDFLVEEIIALGRLPHRTGAAMDRAIAHQAMDALGISHFSTRRYLTLSGGERQRVQIARALAQIWPSSVTSIGNILVLDEPTSALDLAQQHIALERASKFAQQGTLVLAVLHDLNLAATYATRLITMKAGRIVADGVPAQIMTDATVSEWYDCPVHVWHDGYGAPQVQAKRSK
jgi:iron complex transport system ATP-binding protein